LLSVEGQLAQGELDKRDLMAVDGICPGGQQHAAGGIRIHDIKPRRGGIEARQERIDTRGLDAFGGTQMMLLSV